MSSSPVKSPQKGKKSPNSGADTPASASASPPATASAPDRMVAKKKKGGEPSAASASASSPSPAAPAVRAPRAALSPEAQAAKDAELKQRPCFDLAEKKECAQGDKCKFSHDPAILAKAPELKRAQEAARAARDAEREASKEQRAAAKVLRDAEQAAARVEKEAQKERNRVEREATIAKAKAEKEAKRSERAASAKSPVTSPTGEQKVKAEIAEGGKEPRQAKESRARKTNANASGNANNGTGASPVILPTGPAAANGASTPNVPDLTHILVRSAISSKYPKPSPKVQAALQNKPFIIGITGGTASGKTTVCDELQQKLGKKRVAMLQMDRFYYSLPAGKPAASHNFDIPEAFEWDLFVDTLRKLSTGVAVQVPRYSFETHQRLPKLDTFQTADVIMVEGILTLHDPRIREQFDLKVFIEADSDVRLARRITRDVKERARTVESVIDQYIHTVKPAHEKFIQPTATYADIIVPHNGPKNSIAIDLLAQHISTEIYKRGANLAKKQPTARQANNGNAAAEKPASAPAAQKNAASSPPADGSASSPKEPRQKKAKQPKQPKTSIPAPTEQ